MFIGLFTPDRFDIFVHSKLHIFIIHELHKIEGKIQVHKTESNIYLQIIYMYTLRAHGTRSKLFSL